MIENLFLVSYFKRIHVEFHISGDFITSVLVLTVNCVHNYCSTDNKIVSSNLFLIKTDLLRIFLRLFETTCVVILFYS